MDQNFLGDPSPSSFDLGWKYSGRLLQVLAVMKGVVPVCGGEGRGEGGVGGVGGVGGGVLRAWLPYYCQYSKQSNSRIFLCPDRCKRVALYKPI